MVCTSLLGTNTSSQQVKIWADPTSWFLVPEHMLEYQHKISKVKNVYGLYTLVLRYVGCWWIFFLNPLKCNVAVHFAINVQFTSKKYVLKIVKILFKFIQLLLKYYFFFLNEIEFNFIGLVWWIIFHVSISSTVHALDQKPLLNTNHT